MFYKFYDSWSQFLNHIHCAWLQFALFHYKVEFELMKFFYRNFSKHFGLIPFFFEQFTEGIVRLKEKVRKRKGRGFGNESIPREPIDYERMQDDEDELEPGPQRCKYQIFIVTNFYFKFVLV
jgi:hypothetical protein